MPEERPPLILNFLLASTLLNEPDQIALSVVDGSPMTYREFTRTVLTLQKKLSEAGILHGERIVLLGSPTPHWSAAFVAIMTMGAVAVPIMEEFHDSDIEHILEHSEARTIFIQERYFKNLKTPILQRLPMVVFLDDFRVQQLSGEVHHLLDTQPDPLPASGRELSGNFTVSEDDLAQIVYTSGTTGKSKGVMLTHKNLASNVVHGVKHVEVLKKEKVVLSLVPLAHTFGSTQLNVFRRLKLLSI